MRRTSAGLRGLAWAVLLAAPLAAGCGDAGEIIGVAKPPAGEGGAGPAPAGRPTFEAPLVISELCVSDAKDQDPTLTGDLLEIFFFSERSGNPDLWTSRRSGIDEPWEPPVAVDALNSAEDEINPAVSLDGLRIWFHSRREPIGVYYSERASRTSDWGAPAAVTDLAFEGGIIAPALTADELRIAVSVQNDELVNRDVYEAVRASKDAAWGPLGPVPGLNGPEDDSTPFLAEEGHVILMSSGRAGSGDLHWARRESFEQPVIPEPMTELNDPGSLDTHPHLSPDGTRIFFGSGRSGATDLYEARLADR